MVIRKCYRKKSAPYRLSDVILHYCSRAGKDFKLYIMFLNGKINFPSVPQISFSCFLRWFMSKGNNWVYCGKSVDNVWSVRYLPFCKKLHSCCLKNTPHVQTTLKINVKVLWHKVYLCCSLFFFSLLWFTVCCREIYWLYFILHK